MKYHIDPSKKTNWWTHSTFTFFTTFYFISSLEAQQKTCISFEENTNWDTFLPQDTGLHICGGKSVKLEPRTKTLHEFSDAALSHSQFCYKDNFRERCWWGATLCWKCLPSPSALGFVWFLSPCPLEEVFVREVAISLSFTVYGAISLFPRKQSWPDLQLPTWQTTF